MLLVLPVCAIILGENPAHREFWIIYISQDIYNWIWAYINTPMHQFQQQLEQDLELTCHRHRRYLLTYRRRNYVLFYLESQLYHQSCTHIHGHHIPMEVKISNYHLFLLHVYKTCFLSLYLQTDYSLSITFSLCW